MALFEIITEEIKKAMLAKDKVRLEALRGIKKELLEAKTAKGASEELSDETVTAILQKMVKQRKDSAEIYASQNRPDLAEPELEQMRVIQEYLPKQLTPEELERAVKDIITETGASSMKLLGDQEKLLQSIIETGKPLIVIYIQGRPLNMNLASEKAGALLCAWYPGQEGGHAVADILFGNYNPAGRLPVSVPRSVGQLPVYYSLGRQNKYVEGESTPLYAFGYGLSYTQFAYSDLTISQDGDQTDVSCRIKNIGNYDGEEVVQLYVRDNISSVATPPIQLKDFDRVYLKKGESRKVSFTLQPHQLSLFNLIMEEVTEPGEFTVMIGAASNDIRLRGTFEIK
jgi:uncharacterized protein YqeY